MDANEIYIKDKYSERKIEECLRQILNFGTTEISDAMKGENAMSMDIKSIAKETIILGRAYTIDLPSDDSFITSEAINKAKVGDVLVINTNGNKRAVWGDVKTIKSMVKGLGGIVVDGVIRDVKKNIQLGFPIFCKGSVPTASKKNGGGRENIPILCGGVIVKSGDIIYGDDDGVMVIPKGHLSRVAKLAGEKLNLDKLKIEEALVNIKLS